MKCKKFWILISILIPCIIMSLVSDIRAQDNKSKLYRIKPAREELLYRAYTLTQRFNLSDPQKYEALARIAESYRTSGQWDAYLQILREMDQSVIDEISKDFRPYYGQSLAMIVDTEKWTNIKDLINDGNIDQVIALTDQDKKRGQIYRRAAVSHLVKMKKFNEALHLTKNITDPYLAIESLVIIADGLKGIDAKLTPDQRKLLYGVLYTSKQ